MINIMTCDRFGAPCCRRSAHFAFGAPTEFGGGRGVSVPRRKAQLVRPDVLRTFTVAPQTYLNDDVVPPSAALHERSP